MYSLDIRVPDAFNYILLLDDSHLNASIPDQVGPYDRYPQMFLWLMINIFLPGDSLTFFFIAEGSVDGYSLMDGSLSCKVLAGTNKVSVFCPTNHKTS